MPQMIEETARVCACCMILVANGEPCHCDGGHPETLMQHLPGVWYYTGHSYDDDECPDCDLDTGDYCDLANGEAGRWWTCEGCGDTPGMFADTCQISKLTPITTTPEGN